jgi:hypothetical protein
MSERPFSPQDSLQLIQSMIDKTKSNIGENRVYFLFWGWLTFFNILGQFILKVVLRYEHHYLVYLDTIPAVIITIWYSFRHGRSSYRTYIGESMAHLWTGIAIGFFILSFIITRSPGGWINAWPYFILFYGLGTFVSGRLLQFRPLVIGGVFNWVLALTATFIPYDYQMLLAALAILTSYIIPGHMIKSSKHTAYA